ncbi:uncharacterized protein LOC117605998 isoform X1 [Osmia lignaria lignaria]|uniref:uncharacterized protein LOC117605998 isoform X1 n=2 Tax=Osmia lignaria lignaria TaxID=1437193 RepID=UPI00402B244C
MHWQFGGNLEPVQMICELNWKQCPKAIANYIWDEIVTDVLDCLNNESIIWRILAVLLACIMLLHIISCRTKEYIETTVDKEMLNKVGYKMEDLELKVNILTYKMQYGCWPLPHQVKKSNFRKHLRNLRLTMSSPNDRNNWIKHVLLSPRRNESYASYPKYDYRSTHGLTELFDARKKIVYPYLRQENLPVERSSKSSKSSSDKSLKLNSIFKRKLNRNVREASINERFEMQNRNAISLPLFSRNRNNKSTNKLSKDSRRFKSKIMTGACKEFVKTMDECKRYLKELHDSNKNLGLVCTSSNTSDESSIKDWSEIQQQKCEKENKTDKTNKEETDLKKTDTRQKTNEQCLKLSNDICPTLKFSDKRIVPSKMNITFCTDMFPPQSVSNMLITEEPCNRTKFIKTSQEALYRVKRKLESLHNVLRMYEMQNIEAKASAGLQESNNKIKSICQNVVKTIVSATTEADKWNDSKKNRVNFNIDTRKNPDEAQCTMYNSSEHDSDATAKSSMGSVHSYSATFDACPINDPRYLFPNRCETNIYPSIAKLGLMHDRKIVYSSSSKYGKIPERVYYTISSDSDEGKDVKKKTEIRVKKHLDPLPDMYIDKNEEKSFGFSDQYPVPMETDEDLMIMSPTSSHTEMSKDSESEDKSTALLLQEALQFKKALLTRVELEKVCYIEQKKDDTNDQTECDKYTYVNNNLQSKFLDIITEEQSVSSSTDKTSRTYMFYNVKQEKEQPRSSMVNNNIPEIRDSCTYKECLNSKDNLNSPSEYFSFTNIIQENKNQLPELKHNYFQQNVPTQMIPSNVQIKCFKDVSGKSNVKLTEMHYANCLNASNTDTNKQKICYEYINEKENFGKQLLYLNNRSKFMNQSIHSVELYSENLDEAILNEENENSGAGVTNFLNSEQYINVTYDKGTNDSVINTKINVTNNEKYIKDNEIPMHIPNFNLKRHPGACSLIEQVLVADIGKEAETNMMLENDNEIYELSATESKETSTETNLIQDSLTSSINQSNDSNIPEPPSVTVLINKSLEEEKLNLNWLNVNRKFSDDCVNETNIKTSSTNTITLLKYDTANTKNYSKKETTYDNHHDQNTQLKDENKNSITGNLFANLGKEDLNNEADYYKSYTTLVSPHSSLYFTDEASSSTIKLNSHSVSLENHLHSNLYIQKNNEGKLKDEDLKGIKNAETASNENKKMNVTITRNNEETSKQTLSNCESNVYSKNDLPSPKNDIKSTNVLETEIPDSNNSNLLSSKTMNVTPNKIESNLLLDSMERLNVDHKYFSPNTSPREIFPAETNQHESVKSKSHESYTPKLEKLEKSDLRFELLSSDQIRSESNKNSAEPRRAVENNIKLDRKRSRSQTSFRTNQIPKQVASRSHESPVSSISTINDTKSLENKLKLKDHIKCLSPTPKTSSKSCIPILKSRLEAARRSDNETRPKSPMRGPLTMTMFWKDNLCNKNDNVMDEIQVEGKSESNNQYIKLNNSCVEKSDGNNNRTDTTKSPSIVQNTIKNAGNNIAQQEQVVIYVNIFTKQDHNTTKIVDPNKFLEYIKNRELNIQKEVESEDKIKNEIHEAPTENENSRMHKIVTIVSSVINGNELDQQNASTIKTQSGSMFNILTNDQLKNLCFLSVEQREIDVTAKPSVIDTSTSISDLENVLGQSDSVLNKFQICGIPRELNNEEYVTLLEILHQEANFVHLQELQNICKKLVSEDLKSK